MFFTCISLKANNLCQLWTPGLKILKHLIISSTICAKFQVLCLILLALNGRKIAQFNCSKELIFSLFLSAGQRQLSSSVPLTNFTCKFKFPLRASKGNYRRLSFQMKFVRISLRTQWQKSEKYLLRARTRPELSFSGKYKTWKFECR